jgi:hypothetical protein
MGYDVSAWHELFGAEVGAAAALAGLLFVAISINLKRILEAEHLPARAAIGLALLILVLVLATLGLVPGVNRHTYGENIVVIASGVWLVATIHAVRHGRGGRPWRLFLADYGLTQASLVPFIVAGISLIAGAGGGLYWMVWGIVFAFVTAAVNAWVLLVEILR